MVEDDRKEASSLEKTYGIGITTFSLYIGQMKVAFFSSLKQQCDIYFLYFFGPKCRIGIVYS